MRNDDATKKEMESSAEGRREQWPTYAIQIGLDVAVGVDGGFLAAKLVDAADNGNIAANVAVEEGRGHTRGGLRFHRCQSLDQVSDQIRSDQCWMAPDVAGT